MVAGLAAGDPQRLAAVVAEDVADRLRRGLRDDREPVLPHHDAAPRELRARARGIGARCSERVPRGDEPQLRHLAETGIAQEPAVMLEEADHGRALLHCAEVVGQLDVRASGRARARDDGRRTETDGAQADDNGFQNVPPRGGQVHGARRSRAPQASARRCRSCLSLERA